MPVVWLADVCRWTCDYDTFASVKRFMKLILVEVMMVVILVLPLIPCTISEYIQHVYSMSTAIIADMSVFNDVVYDTCHPLTTFD